MALLAAQASPELVKVLGRWRSDAWRAYNHPSASFGSSYLLAACDTHVEATEALLDDELSDVDIE